MSCHSSFGELSYNCKILELCFFDKVCKVLGIYILVCKRKKFLSILMPSVIRVHFSQLVDHCGHTPHNIIEHTHAKKSISLHT